MFASVPFFLSAFLLAGFLGFRVYEEKKGIEAYASYRKILDARVTTLYEKAVLGGIPKEWRHMLFSVLHKVLHSIVLLSVDLLRAIERPLARLSHRMRMQAPNANGKDVSPFLKTITPERSESKGLPPLSEQTVGDRVSDASLSKADGTSTNGNV